MTKPDLRGFTPESWACIDCGISTAPGHHTREQLENAFALDLEGKGVTNTYTELTEIYTVKDQVWRAAGMAPMGGCLCIGCLEKRLGRMLTPKDLPRDDAFNITPGTERLLARRGHRSPLPRGRAGSGDRSDPQ